MSEQKPAFKLPACPVETTLTLIGDKWKVLILRDLMQRIAKGPDRAASGYGKKRACQPQGICGSTAKSGIFSHRAGTELKADS